MIWLLPNSLHALVLLSHIFCFICTFSFSNLPSYFYQVHPSSHSNALSYYFNFSIYHNLKLSCLFISFFVYSRKCELHEHACFFPTVFPGPRKGPAHCRHADNLCLISILSSEGHYIWLYSVSPLVGQHHGFHRIIVQNSCWMNIVPVPSSSLGHLLSAWSQESVMFTASFSPHLYFIVWDYIVRRGHGLSIAY